MSDLPTKTIQASISGAGSFCFYNNNIVAISDEGYIKKFELNNNSEGLKVIDSIPVSKKITQIASNEKDNIVYSGTDKIVHMAFKEKYDRASNIAKLENIVHRIAYPNKRVVLIFPEATGAQVYWTEQEKVTVILPEHQNTVLNGDIDPSCEFIATTGCDGMLHICKLDEDSNKIEMVIMKEISEKLELDSEQKLQVSWSSDGNTLAIAGAKELRVAERRDLTELQTISEISHDDPISHLCWVNENILITADVKNTVKIWNYDTKTVVYKYTNSHNIVSMKYSSSMK